MRRGSLRRDVSAREAGAPWWAARIGRAGAVFAVVALAGGGAVACSTGSDIDPAWVSDVSQRLPDPAVRGLEGFGSPEQADLIGRFLEMSVSAFAEPTDMPAEKCHDLVRRLREDAPAEELFRSAASVTDRALSQLVMNSRQQVGAYLTRCIGGGPALGAPEPSAAPGASVEIVRQSLRLAAGRYQEVRG